uniref:Reverse transcriptase domain-containing protein n=1 Tax=Tanacetum cinerariifolium TaxID=118510 RepID=A0A699JJA5_TANCI|nr:hypothetical protein [Tanacetum cinerariifolium]
MQVADAFSHRNEEDKPLEDSFMTLIQPLTGFLGDCQQQLGFVGNVHKTFHELAKGKYCLVLMAKMLEVEVAMVEEEVEGLLVCQREFKERGEVKVGGVVFGVSWGLLGEVPREIMGESGGEVFGVDRGAVR